jgi:hypothetical protein
VPGSRASQVSREPFTLELPLTSVFGNAPMVKASSTYFCETQHNGR